jgi:hypothetical protein
MLADLDELILRCRDERAKTYIGEAVSCYKAGAYRAAIISTWTAVMFDIIDKLRELALAGDKAATNIVADFDSIIEANNIQGAQRFERELLSTAKEPFELISQQEFLDLQRLQEDRHRCAHPSQSRAGVVFSPTAELARLHIRNAIEHLLQHEPAQGNAALASLLTTIKSSYFPTQKAKALAILASSPLKRARTSLIRNLVQILLKEALTDARMWPASGQRAAALLSIAALHPAKWTEALKEDITRLIRAVTADNGLVRAIILINIDPSCAEALEEDQRVRLSEFVANLPPDLLDHLDEFLLHKGFVYEAACRRAKGLTVEEVSTVSATSIAGLAKEVCDRVVQRYIRAMSFDAANDWGKRVVADVGSFSIDQVQVILNGALQNPEIRGSYQLRHVTAAIKQSEAHKDEAIAELVARVEAVTEIPF